MLHEFVTAHREAIVARTREKLTHRPWPTASTNELEHGVPLFLTQLSETLRWESTPTPFVLILNMTWLPPVHRWWHRVGSGR